MGNITLNVGGTDFSGDMDAWKTLFSGLSTQGWASNVPEGLSIPKDSSVMEYGKVKDEGRKAAIIVFASQYSTRDKSGPEVVDLIREKFGVDVSRTTVANWMVNGIMKRSMIRNKYVPAAVAWQNGVSQLPFLG
jgi:hypothetical protein